MQSDANLVYQAVLLAPRRFQFTRPFLIALRRRGREQPYFLMRVDNAELLCKEE
jgi:hypothetical protein